MRKNINLFILFYFFFFLPKTSSLTGKFARKELHILAVVRWGDGTYKKASQTALERWVRKLADALLLFSIFC